MIRPSECALLWQTCSWQSCKHHTIANDPDCDKVLHDLLVRPSVCLSVSLTDHLSVCVSRNTHLLHDKTLKVCNAVLDLQKNLFAVM